MNKTHEPNSIDQYIETFPKEVQEKLLHLRKAIKEVIPEAEETISYQMPTFKINGKYIVYFAAFKKHIGFYPFPSGIEAFKKESSDYVTSTGAIQFPFDKPIPFDLVKKIVKFRVKENLEKEKSKKIATKDV
jgi:uncharacterized protein YdhG (YjbR/CyaY superfamily)